MRKIALSGLIAVTALLGGVAVPATAMAQPTSGVRPVSAVPARPDADAVVTDVAGPKISCVLAGESGTGALSLDRWNGKKLTTMRPAGNAIALAPTEISCATPSNCAVTGANFGATNAVTGFTEIWNGTKWQVAATPWPKATGQAVLWGASCYGAHSCEAVGFAGPTLGQPPADAAAVSYRGTRGTQQAVAKPPAGHSSVFTAVSCLPWGTCVAVGDIGKSTTTTPAAVTGVWNGKSWKLGPGL